MEEKFVLEQLRRSDRYIENVDVLSVVLKRDVEYTLDEVDEAVKAFLEKEEK